MTTHQPDSADLYDALSTPKQPASTGSLFDRLLHRMIDERLCETLQIQVAEDGRVWVHLDGVTVVRVQYVGKLEIVGLPDGPMVLDRQP